MTKRQEISLELNEGEISPLRKRACMELILIKDITTFTWNRKCGIRCRIISKELYSYKNRSTECLALKLVVTDSTGEIKVKVYHDDVEKINETIDEGKIYEIKKGVVTKENYKTGINHDYAINLDKNSQIDLCGDDQSIPKWNFQFTRIADLQERKGIFCDVIGLCEMVHEIDKVFITKRNEFNDRRYINLLDSSNTKIKVTLWGKIAREFKGKENDVIAIKGVQWKEYKGCNSVSSLYDTYIVVNPCIEETQEIRNWHQMIGNTTEVISLTKDITFKKEIEWKTIKEIEQHKTGEIRYYTEAKVNRIFDTYCMYQGCPKSTCKKKIDGKDGQFYCQNCDKNYENCIYRYKLKLELSDKSGDMRVMCWENSAEQLLGIEAQSLHLLKESNEKEYDEKITGPIEKTYVVKIKCGISVYNNKEQLNITVEDWKEVREKVEDTDNNPCFASH